MPAGLLKPSIIWNISDFDFVLILNISQFHLQRFSALKAARELSEFWKSDPWQFLTHMGYKIYVSKLYDHEMEGRTNVLSIYRFGSIVSSHWARHKSHHFLSIFGFSPLAQFKLVIQYMLDTYCPVKCTLHKKGCQLNRIVLFTANI